MFLNIIGNSIKYKSADRNLTIKIIWDKKDNKIIFRDNGMGFDNEEAKDIFSPLYRLKSSKNSVEGHGLGLAMCANIAQGQGWGLSATGEKNVGADIVIHLLKPG